MIDFGTPVRRTGDGTRRPRAADPVTTLRIVDADSEPHIVTAVDGSFDSGSFDPDSPAKLTAPAKPGTYKITCTIHPSMEGEIVVQ